MKPEEKINVDANPEPNKTDLSSNPEENNTIKTTGSAEETREGKKDTRVTKEKKNKPSDKVKKEEKSKGKTDTRVTKEKKNKPSDKVKKEEKSKGKTDTTKSKFKDSKPKSLKHPIIPNDEITDKGGELNEEILKKDPDSVKAAELMEKHDVKQVFKVSHYWFTKKEYAESAAANYKTIPKTFNKE